MGSLRQQSRKAVVTPGGSFPTPESLPLKLLERSRPGRSSGGTRELGPTSSLSTRREAGRRSPVSTFAVKAAFEYYKFPRSSEPQGIVSIRKLNRYCNKDAFA